MRCAIFSFFLLVAIAIALEDGSIQKEKDLAELRFIRKIQTQPNSKTKTNRGKAPAKCIGGTEKCKGGLATKDCCQSNGYKCGKGEGHCRNDGECADGLVCGTDNCGAGFPSIYFDCCQSTEGQVGPKGQVVMRTGVECGCQQQEPEQIQATGEVILYCPLSSVPLVGGLLPLMVRSGNYMDVRGVGTRKLRINDVITYKCVNNQDSCSCTALFRRVLQRFGGAWVQVISLNFNGYAGMQYWLRFDDCRCFLGEAYAAGYLYVAVRGCSNSFEIEDVQTTCRRIFVTCNPNNANTDLDGLHRLTYYSEWLIARDPPCHPDCIPTVL